LGGHHHHHHDCSGDHYGRRFAIGVAFNVAFVVVECTFGFLANSMALLADAGHNLSDVLGLLLAWGAHRLAKRQPSSRFTYGLRSSTILAALANSLLLMVAVGGILWEAAHRFGDPEPSSGWTMLIVAAVGVVINLATAFLFFHGRHDDLNIRAAFLHMAADAAVSLGVVVGGVLVLRFGLTWIDPAIGVAIAVVILISTWDVLKDSTVLALHAVPRNVNPDNVREYLTTRPEILSLHDLHIWAMSTTETALTAHVVVADSHPAGELAVELEAELQSRFGIDHSTIQVESAAVAAACRQTAIDSV
jgi:cobalt-zinc-cadmium efflux system protein